MATLAVFAGGGGLGNNILNEANLKFPTALVIALVIVVLMAFACDLVLLDDPTVRDALAAGGEGGRMSAALLTHPLFAGFAGAFEFIFHKQSSNVTGGAKVGGFDKTVELIWTQIYVSALALVVAMLIAIPVGLYFGHRGKGELVAVGIGNAGRAVPELVVIALVATVIGVGVPTLTIALAVLGIPSILTNTFVGIRQVDRATVDAARGIGMSEFEILRKVELPLAVPAAS